MSTTALEITPSSPVVQPGSIGGGTDNVPPTPTNPQLFFHSDAADVGSQASPAQPQAASREAKANRTQVPVETPALPQLPSISHARPPSLVPSDLISTRTRRRPAPSRRRWFLQACRRLRFQPSEPCAAAGQTTSHHRATPPTATAPLVLPREARPSYRLGPHRPHWVCH